MNPIVAWAILVLTVLSVLTAVAALVIKTLREGSLQADYRWAKAYITKQFKHYHRTTH